MVLQVQIPEVGNNFGHNNRNYDFSTELDLIETRLHGFIQLQLRSV